jgi:hypothetical protein
MFEIIPGGNPLSDRYRSGGTILRRTVEISRPIVFLDECFGS